MFRVRGGTLTQRKEERAAMRRDAKMPIWMWGKERSKEKFVMGNAKQRERLRRLRE